MRTSADERLLLPWAARPRSRTSTRPARRFARWKAIEAPTTPAPTTMKSAVLAPAGMATLATSCAPEVREDLVGGVVARRAGHASARMRAGSAEIEAADGRPVARPARHRAHEEELLEHQVAVEDVALGEAVGALEIERRQHLPGLDRARDVRRVTRDRPDDAVSELLAALVPASPREAVGDVLHEARHDVFAARRQAVVDVRGDDAVDPQIVRDLSPRGGGVGALREIQGRHKREQRSAPRIGVLRHPV